MVPDDVSLFRCPRCHGPFSFGRTAPAPAKAVETARLVCRRCGRGYPLRNGVPRLVVSGDLDADRKQTQASYSDKWSRQPDYGTRSEKTREFHHAWYLRRYGHGTEKALRRFLSPFSRILDAGTGLGRDTLWYSSLTKAKVFGVDISSSVDIVRRQVADPSRTTLVQGDIMNLPFRSGAFDFVACDMVLPCVADPESGLKELARLVRPGGHLAFYLYRRRGPIREFSNDYLRERVMKMPAAQAWEVCRAITQLGRTLSDLKTKVRIQEDIPLLEIKKGTYDLQRFFFYNVLKCFWSDSHTFDENNLVNFDWYHPAFTYRHSEEEVQAWIRKLGLKVSHFDHDEPSGISVLARKPGRA